MPTWHSAQVSAGSFVGAFILGLPPRILLHDLDSTGGADAVGAGAHHAFEIRARANPTGRFASDLGPHNRTHPPHVGLLGPARAEPAGGLYELRARRHRQQAGGGVLPPRGQSVLEET